MQLAALAVFFLAIAATNMAAAMQVACPDLEPYKPHYTHIPGQVVGDNTVQIESCVFGSSSTSSANPIVGATWVINVSKPTGPRLILRLSHLTLQAPDNAIVSNALIIYLPTHGVDVEVSDVNVTQWLFFVGQRVDSPKHKNKLASVGLHEAGMEEDWVAAGPRSSSLWRYPLSVAEKYESSEASSIAKQVSAAQQLASLSDQYELISNGMQRSSIAISGSSFTRHRQASTNLYVAYPDMFTLASGKGVMAVWSVFTLGVFIVGGNFSVSGSHFSVTDSTVMGEQGAIPGLVLPFGFAGGSATIAANEKVSINDNVFNVVSLVPATTNIADRLTAISSRCSFTLNGPMEVMRNDVTVVGNTVQGISAIGFESFVGFPSGSMHLMYNLIDVVGDAPGAVPTFCVSVWGGSYFNGSTWMVSHNVMNLTTSGDAAIAILFLDQPVIDFNANFIAAGNNQITVNTNAYLQTTQAAGFGGFAAMVTMHCATLSVINNVIKVKAGTKTDALYAGSRAAGVLIDGGVVMETGSHVNITGNTFIISGTADHTTGVELFQKKMTNGAILRISDNVFDINCMSSICAGYYANEYGLVSVMSGSHTHYDGNDITINGTGPMMGGWINLAISRIMGSSSATSVGGTIRARSTDPHAVVTITYFKHALMTCTGSELRVQNITFDKDYSTAEDCGNINFVIDECPVMKTISQHDREGWRVGYHWKWASSYTSPVRTVIIEPLQPYSGWGHLAIPVNFAISTKDLVQPVNPSALLPCGSSERPCPQSRCNVDRRNNWICSQMSQQQLEGFFFSMLATGNSSATIPLNKAVCANNHFAEYAVAFGKNPLVELSCNAEGNVTIVTADNNYLLYTFPSDQDDSKYGVRMHCSACHSFGTPLANPQPISMMAVGAVKSVLITVIWFSITYFFRDCATGLVRIYAKVLAVLGNIRDGPEAEHIRKTIVSQMLPQPVSMDFVRQRLRVLLDGKKPAPKFTFYCCFHIFADSIPREEKVQFLSEDSTFHTKRIIQQLHRDYVRARTAWKRNQRTAGSTPIDEEAFTTMKTQNGDSSDGQFTVPSMPTPGNGSLNSAPIPMEEQRDREGDQDAGDLQRQEQRPRTQTQSSSATQSGSAMGSVREFVHDVLISSTGGFAGQEGMSEDSGSPRSALQQKEFGEYGTAMSADEREATLNENDEEDEGDATQRPLLRRDVSVHPEDMKSTVGFLRKSLSLSPRQPVNAKGESASAGSSGSGLDSGILSSGERTPLGANPDADLDRSLRMAQRAVHDYPSEWERARLVTRVPGDSLLPMRWWVLANLGFNVVLLVSAIVAAARTDTFPKGYAWHRLQLAYFTYCNSSTSATLLVNSYARCRYLNNRWYKDWLFMSCVILALPALVSHCIPGFFAFIWILGPVLFIGLLFEHRVAAFINRVRVESPLAEFGIRAFARLVFSLAVIIVLSASYNYAMLFIWEVRLQPTVTYWQVPTRDFNARSMVCILNHMMENVASILSAMGTLVSAFS